MGQEIIRWIRGTWEYAQMEGGVPSERSGRATGEAKAMATRDKRVMIENCIFAVVLIGSSW